MAEHLVFCLLLRWPKHHDLHTPSSETDFYYLTHIYNKHTSYVELYDPEQGDEQEVKGDEEAEGPPHV